MDGVESYTELLASVAGSGFARVAANDLGTAASVVHSPCVDPVSNGGSHLGQIHRSSSSSGSDSLSSCGEEDDDPVAVSEPYFPTGSNWKKMMTQYPFKTHTTRPAPVCSLPSTVLSGGDYLRSKHIRGAFVGDHLKYDVQHCRHIIAPVPSSTGFSCCIWDISARDLLVLDPTMMNSTRKNSGLYTMHYARWYAGLGLARSITDVELGEVREDMFYQLLSMTSNVGDLPGLFWRLK
ncbi:hypothetical protein ACQ4PT_040438 [Festuca glaucescens]